MYVVARCAPDGSPLARALDPRATWSTSEELLAYIFDQNNIMIWQNGGCRGPAPKPLQRPWGKPGTESKETAYTGEVMPMDQMQDYLAQWLALDGQGHVTL